MKASACRRFRHAPGADGSPPCHFTSGSSNSPTRSRSPRRTASKPRRARSTFVSATSRLWHRESGRGSLLGVAPVTLPHMVSNAGSTGEQLVARLRAALNAHDLDAFVACFAEDYDSVQPA